MSAWVIGLVWEEIKVLERFADSWDEREKLDGFYMERKKFQNHGLAIDRTPTRAVYSFAA